MIWGAPGIGKSSIVQSIACKNKLELIDFLKKILETRDNILLKGSRSMRMEEILDLWK